MTKSNLKRLTQLAEDVFAVKNDPDQLNVDHSVIVRLMKMHSSTLSEFDDGNGPAAWVLLIPTTHELMNKFLRHEISERELYELTPDDAVYDALYLCSALVLEEHRRKGITKRLTVEAIEDIRKDYPISTLFVWPFSPEGERAAITVADMLNLPLFIRTAH
jgi:ribosomal protein S18 acetylase RimI-like enzyme